MYYLEKRSLALLNTFKNLDKVGGISLDNMITDDMRKFVTYWRTFVSKGEQIKNEFLTILFVKKLRIFKAKSAVINISKDLYVSTNNRNQDYK